MAIKDIFRKYDIRGTVGSDFDIQDFYKVTKSTVYFLKKKNKSLQTIAVGMDGRIHSNALKEIVCDAIIDSGINVRFVGLCPSPAFYFATHRLDVQAGIMITASHNPGADNGMKIVLNQEPVYGDDIQEIYKFFYQNFEIKTKKKGIYDECFIIPEYIDFLISKFSHLKNLEVNAILNCCNGTGGIVLSQLIEKMNFKNFDLLFSEVDGNFPNHEPDPTVVKSVNYLKTFLSKNYKFALGLDGDCDRLCLINKEGKLIPGDQLLAVFAQSILKNNNKSIVFDIKCSNALVEFCQKNNIKAFITPTGSSYIKEFLKRNNAMIGGELSGHYCFNDDYFGYDDGIYATLRLFDIINKNEIDELLQNYPKRISSKEIRINCAESKKDLVIKAAKKKLLFLKSASIIEIDGIRVDTPYGWGILRASNTEPMLSMRFEGEDLEGLQQIKNNFYEAIMMYFENDYLKQKLELL